MKDKERQKTKSAVEHGYSPFDRLQNQVDRVFSDFSRGFHWPEIFSGQEVAVMPSMEVHHTNGSVTVTAELPGVAEDEIDISVVDQMVTISGEKKSEIERKEDEFYRSERSYGSFRRSVTLPFEIDADKVDAKFDKGVLILTIEKPAEARKKSRKIKIKH